MKIIIYIILISIAALIFLVNIIIKIRAVINKKRLIRIKKRSFKIDNYFAVISLNTLNKSKLLKKEKNKYASKLCLINSNTRHQNELIIAFYFFTAVIISLSVGIWAMIFLTMWYTPIAFFTVGIFLICYIGITYISINLNKVYSQFPIALQIFTDEYVVTKNIKNALNLSYSKMPKEIGYLFENLSRKLDSKNHKEVLKNFSEGLDLLWGYAFTEMLTLSYEGADDISEELIYLNELTSEEMKEDEETSAAISESSNIFIVLNIITACMFIFNLFVSPNAKNLYLGTPNGNGILLYWIVSIILGICISNIMKKI